MDVIANRLKRIATDLLSRHDPVSDELRAILGVDASRPMVNRTFRLASEKSWTATTLTLGGAADPESIVRTGRPVLHVSGGRPDLSGNMLGAWRDYLEKAQLERSIGAVGRIEVQGDPLLRYAGTGWLIEPDVVVTNRHVAVLFAARRGGEFTFLQGVGQRMAARVDFYEEHGRDEQLNATVVEVIWIADPTQPDVAFLRIARPLSLATQAIVHQDAIPPVGTPIAVVGYPARDRDFPDQARMVEVFGDVYEKKRLAPGFITGRHGGILKHDCSTLRGNSGSPVLSLETGSVIGLHYQGVFGVDNYAVSAERVRNMLDLTRKPRHRTTGKAVSPSKEASLSKEALMSQECTFTIPLHITVRVGAVTHVSGGAEPPRSVAVPQAQMTEDEVLNEARRLFSGRADVVAVRMDTLYCDGHLTDERGIIVKTRSSLREGQESALAEIPSTLHGYTVDVESAQPEDLERQVFDFRNEAVGRQGQYQAPTGFSLDEIPEEDEYELVCHASPDAGWPVLRDFLDQTKERLTIGMYELTAPHVVDTLLDTLRDSGTLDLAIQGASNIGGEGSKAHDLDEEEVVVPQLREVLGPRLNQVWVPTGGRSGLVPTAYHIKLAVRDGRAVWCSSGSWQSSNVPNVDPTADVDDDAGPLANFNREWHLVVTNERLAETLEKYVRWDIEQSRELRPGVALDEYVAVTADAEAAPRRVTEVRYFAPLSIKRTLKLKPLLTPDGYWRYVADLIRSAESSLCFQNQSMSILMDRDTGSVENVQDDHFKELLDALLEAQKRLRDFRVIVRGDFLTRDHVRAWRKWGFDLSRFKRQDRCHNKGIIVDEKSILVGSHNWTNAGTAWNRDLSMIIEDEEVTTYFKNIFEYDWEYLATPVEPLTDLPVFRVPADAPTPRGFVRRRE